MNKPIIELTEKRFMIINVMYVHKANFNDTHYIEDLVFDLDELCEDELVWFDPYLGRSKIDDTLVAISYCGNNEIKILAKKNGEIKEHIADGIFECIISEPFDESLFLASHISFRITVPKHLLKQV